MKGFRRVKGHKEMPKLVAALRARDQQRGLVVNDAEKVAESSTEPSPNFNSERGNPIRVGERVTGWCAASLRVAMNADASLDLATSAAEFEPPLRSTLSIPLQRGDQLLGVLTGYSIRKNPFDESHRYAFEEVAAGISGGVAMLRPRQAATNIVSFRTERPAPHG